MKGLKHLVQDTANAPYPLHVERWLRREFYSMENSREMYVFLSSWKLKEYSSVGIHVQTILHTLYNCVELRIQILRAIKLFILINCSNYYYLYIYY